MSNWTEMKQYLEVIEKDYHVPGGEIMVWKDGEKIFHETFGDRKLAENAGKDTYWLYSMTKVYTAVSMMQLYERGLIGLEQSITEFFPELADLKITDAEGNPLHIEKCTVRNLLSMTGGLSYNTGGDALAALREKDEPNPAVEEVVKAIFQSALVYEPGTHFQYSMCHDVCGALIQKVTGLRLDEYMQKNIFEPLGITKLGFFPTEEQQERFTAQYGADTGEILPRANTNHIMIARDFCCGGSGLFGNLEDYMKLARALANKGTADNGYQVLKPETVEKLREDQLTPMGVIGDLHTRFPQYGRDGFSYALGVRTKIRETGDSPIGEFGWDGAAGGYILIDPENRLALGYLQHVVNMGVVYDEVHPKLREILYRTLK